MTQESQQAKMAKLIAKHNPAAKPAVTLDAIDPSVVVLDAAGEAVKHDNQALAKKAMTAFYSLSDIDEDDLDENEGLGGRLKALLVGIVSSDNDDDEVDLSEEDSDQIDVCRAAIGEYLSNKGCEKSDVDAMLNDFDSGATERCVSGAVETLDDCDDESEDEDDDSEKDDKATMDSIDSFVFGELDCSETAEMIALDDASFDATYKKKMTIVGGKKKLVKKRVSGKVKLSAKQKQGIKKMLKKSHKSGAKRARAKSMKVRKKKGL